MIHSKDSFTESFSALQLPELINSQTIRHSLHDSAHGFTITYSGMVRSRTIVHNHKTWCYTDVSNTALILAVRLLNVNQLLCPEWVSDTASLSAQESERESRLQRRESWVTAQMWFTSWRPSFANDLLRTWITFALSLNQRAMNDQLRITFTNVSDFYCAVKIT